MVIWALALLLSCSHYILRNVDNPLKEYGIERLAMPMFVNQSAFPGVAPIFTKQIGMLLAQYPGLKVLSETDSNIDAVLIGIVGSPGSLKKAIIPGEKELKAPAGLKGRRVYLPRVLTVKVNLRLILVKNPTHNDVKFFLKHGNLSYKHPKVIWERSMDFNGGVERNIFVDEDSITNYTKDRGSEKRMFEMLAIQAANQFKEFFLYAF